jgi:hypothetical protein
MTYGEIHGIVTICVLAFSGILILIDNYEKHKKEKTSY